MSDLRKIYIFSVLILSCQIRASRPLFSYECELILCVAYTEYTARRANIKVSIYNRVQIRLHFFFFPLFTLIGDYNT